MPAKPWLRAMFFLMARIVDASVGPVFRPRGHLKTDLQSGKKLQFLLDHYPNYDHLCSWTNCTNLHKQNCWIRVRRPLSCASYNFGDDLLTTDEMVVPCVSFPLFVSTNGRVKSFSNQIALVSRSCTNLGLMSPSKPDRTWWLEN